MKKDKILLWLVVTLILGGTVFALAKLPKKDQLPLVTGKLQPVSASDWITANPNSKITLVEYGDFQCPACGAYHPILKELLQKNGQDFRFVFRNFPLSQHANAKIAAYAAGAAGLQGKFWEMHDWLFENQAIWESSYSPTDLFTNYAKTINLNLPRFSGDLASAEVQNKVQNDYNSGIQAGVHATPTFYLNGKQIQPQSYQEFASLIKQANSTTPIPSATP